MSHRRDTTTRQVADDALYRSENSSGGGGGGITQLTGQVTAGPGSGSQAATVAGKQKSIFYVAIGGSDASGTGNLFNPFATYNAAAAAAIAAGAGAGAFAVVPFGPGVFNQAIALRPFVDLVGFDSTNSLGYGSAASTVLMQAPTLGAGFTGAGPNFAGLANVEIAANVAWDFAAAGVTGTAGIQIANSNTADISVTGIGLGVKCGVVSSTTGNIAIVDARLDSQATEISGNFTMTAPSHGAEAFLLCSPIDGSISVDGSAGNAATVKNLGSTLRSSLTLTGALASYVTSLEGIGNNLTLAGGAPSPQIFGSGSALAGQTLVADGGGNWTFGSAGGVTWADDLAGSTGTAQFVGAISGVGGAFGAVPVADATYFTFLVTGQTTSTNARLNFAADVAGTVLGFHFGGSDFQLLYTDGARDWFLSNTVVGGQITVVSPNVELAGGGNTLTLSGAGGVFNAGLLHFNATPITCDGASPITATFNYTPAVPANWAGAAPTTVQQALDRIAANTLNAHPIP
jgi:hypothetical protein